MRTIVRLDEALKARLWMLWVWLCLTVDQEYRNATRIVGDTVLFQKFEEASRMIKRDIVFASSLYIS